MEPSIPIGLQRILFWTAFWAIVATVFHLVSVVFALFLGIIFEASNITAITVGEILLEGLPQIIVNAGMGTVGGLLWIGMKGERFGNLGSFIFWAVYWTLFDAVTTAIMLMMYGFFNVRVTFAILPGIIGMFGLYREKKFFHQHLAPKLKEVQ
ncbi:MAG: hypothetical protein GY797_04100 [Deltaproteobacteria bacterium]|nr:hypothetical protein [Deltaproteobacteria bacterium]